MTLWAATALLAQAALLPLWAAPALTQAQTPAGLLLLSTGFILIAAPLPGMRRLRPRAYIWASILALFLLVHGLVDAWAPPHPLAAARGLVEAILASLVFFGSLRFIRSLPRPDRKARHAQH